MKKGRKGVASEREVAEEARTGKDILPLAEFPFALLSPWRPQNKNVLEFRDQVRTPDGRIIERTWTVIGSEELGLPVSTDEDVFIALLEVAKEQGFSSRHVHFTQSNLIKRMGWPHKGDSMERLKTALDRLTSVTIRSRNVIFNKETQEFWDVAFHILEGYQLYKLVPHASPQKAFEFNFVTWSEVVWTLIVQGQLKDLNTRFYFSLERPISRRLYRHLDKRFMDRKRRYTVELTRLAFNHLGLAPGGYPSQIKQRLAPAHEELLDWGYLRKVEYRERAGEWTVIYYPGPLAKERQEEPPPSLPLPMPEEGVVKALESLGVARQVALQLVGQFGAEAVRRQLEFLPYRPRVKNVAGMLVQAIRQNWPPPPEWEERRRREEEAKRKLAQVESEKRHSREVSERIKRIKSRLSPAELERLRQEALSRLPKGLREKAERSKGGLAQMVEAMVEELIKERFLEEK